MELPPIRYGTNSLDSYLEAGRGIAQDVDRNERRFIVRINRAFFEGGPLDSKSCTSILSARVPVVPNGISETNPPCVVIRERDSWYTYVEYVEYIPVLGSVVAIISFLAHFYLGSIAEDRLREAVGVFRSPINKDEAAATEVRKARTDRVFQAAIDCTIHTNHMTRSAIAITPLLKICFTAWQVIKYNPAPQN